MSAVELMVEGAHTLTVTKPEVYRNGSIHQTLELNGKAVSDGKVLMIDRDRLQVLIQTTAGGRVNFDRVIAKRRIYLGSLNQQMTDLNHQYAGQRGSKRSERGAKYDEYISIRYPLLETKRQLSSAQARDKLTLRELIREGVFK